MRILKRDQHIRCLQGEMSKKLDHSLVNLLTKGFICATRSLEDRFHLILENRRCFTLHDQSKNDTKKRGNNRLRARYLHVDL
jgi:hypothetical protein